MYSGSIQIVNMKRTEHVLTYLDLIQSSETEIQNVLTMYYVPGSIQSLPIPDQGNFFLESKLLRMTYKVIYDLASAFLIFLHLCLPQSYSSSKTCHHAFFSSGCQPGNDTFPNLSMKWWGTHLEIEGAFLAVMLIVLGERAGTTDIWGQGCQTPSNTWESLI